MSEYVRGQLLTYCDLVKKGKPASNFPLQTRHEKQLRLIVEEEGVNIHIEHLSEGWFTVWIYKYPHILDVIKEIPSNPKSTYDHWILGKLFGYEENSIYDFINKINENQCGHS